MIVNYDTPWNPTRLIQRLGRINRIGTKAQLIYNYNFYPSQHGDLIINLKERSEAKLQSSHTAYGEDSRIYSLREIIEQWSMFEEKEEEPDIRTQWLEWLRKYREQDEEHFNSIRKMPLKVRCVRAAKEKETSIAFVKNGEYKNIYLHGDGRSFAVSFEKAVRMFEASKTEEGFLPVPESHYTHINKILEQFTTDITTLDMIGGSDDKLDIRSNKALNDLNSWLANQVLATPEAIEAGMNLLPLLKHGTYTNLTNEVYKLRNETNATKLENELIKLSRKYTSKIKKQAKKEPEPLQPKIIISETFVS